MLELGCICPFVSKLCLPSWLGIGAQAESLLATAARSLQEVEPGPLTDCKSVPEKTVD